MAEVTTASLKSKVQSLKSKISRSASRAAISQVVRGLRIKGRERLFEKRVECGAFRRFQERGHTAHSKRCAQFTGGFATLRSSRLR